MPYDLPTLCPICNEGFHVSRLQCKRCGSALEGDFKLEGISVIAPAMQKFILDFFKCRGNIREMEKLYNISYPTVRSRIDEIVAKLGGQPEQDEMHEPEGLPETIGKPWPDKLRGPGGLPQSDEPPPADNYPQTNENVERVDGGVKDSDEAGDDAKNGAATGGDSKAARREILESLAKGDIDLESAHELLKSIPPNIGAN